MTLRLLKKGRDYAEPRHGSRQDDAWERFRKIFWTCDSSCLPIGTATVAMVVGLSRICGVLIPHPGAVGGKKKMKETCKVGIVVSTLPASSSREGGLCVKKKWEGFRLRWFLLAAGADMVTL